jgi:hypothetical protein
MRKLLDKPAGKPAGNRWRAAIKPMLWRQCTLGADIRDSAVFGGDVHFNALSNRIPYQDISLRASPLRGLKRQHLHNLNLKI